MRAVAEVSTGGVQTCLFSAAHSPAAVGPVGGKTEEQEQQKKKKAVLGACREAWQPSSKAERESGCGNKDVGLEDNSM